MMNTHSRIQSALLKDIHDLQHQLTSCLAENLRLTQKLEEAHEQVQSEKQDFQKRVAQLDQQNRDLDEEKRKIQLDAVIQVTEAKDAADREKAAAETAKLEAIQANERAAEKHEAAKEQALQRARRAEDAIDGAQQAEKQALLRATLAEEALQKSQNARELALAKAQQADSERERALRELEEVQRKSASLVQAAHDHLNQKLEEIRQQSQQNDEIARQSKKEVLEMQARVQTTQAKLQTALVALAGAQHLATVELVKLHEYAAIKTYTNCNLPFAEPSQQGESVQVDGELREESGRSEEQTHRAIPQKENSLPQAEREVQPLQNRGTEVRNAAEQDEPVCQRSVQANKRAAQNDTSAGEVPQDPQQLANEALRGVKQPEMQAILQAVEGIRRQSFSLLQKLKKMSAENNAMTDDGTNTWLAEGYRVCSSFLDQIDETIGNLKESIAAELALPSGIEATDASQIRGLRTLGFNSQSMHGNILQSRQQRIAEEEGGTLDQQLCNPPARAPKVENEGPAHPATEQIQATSRMIHPKRRIVEDEQPHQDASVPVSSYVQTENDGTALSSACRNSNSDVGSESIHCHGTTQKGTSPPSKSDTAPSWLRELAFSAPGSRTALPALGKRKR